MVKVGEVKYGNRVIVREQEVEIPEGLNCLLGPSGLGKSTFLKTLNKVLKWPFIPQEPRLPSHATALDLVEYQSKFNKCVTPRKMVENFFEISKELGIRDKVEMKLGRLSSGERQRVSVALALARGCEGLLADEPTSQLDPLNAMKVMNAIISRSERALVVTHDLIAIAFCDRYFTLKGGYLRPSSVEEALGVGLEDLCSKHFKAKALKSLSKSSSTSSGEVS